MAFKFEIDNTVFFLKDGSVVVGKVQGRQRTDVPLYIPEWKRHRFADAFGCVRPRVRYLVDYRYESQDYAEIIDESQVFASKDELAKALFGVGLAGA